MAYTLNPEPKILSCNPYILHSASYTTCPTPCTLRLKLSP